MGNESSKSGGKSSRHRSSMSAGAAPAGVEGFTASPQTLQSAAATHPQRLPTPKSGSPQQSHSNPFPVSQGPARSGSTDLSGSLGRSESMSMARYVDANSLVYIPSGFPDQQQSFLLSPRAGPQGPQSTTDSVPIQVQAPTSQQQQSSRFVIGTPTSKAHSLQSRKPPSGLAIATGSTPIIIPTYNASSAVAEEGTSGSPMLRSYHQHSFTRKDPHADLSMSSPALGLSPSSRKPTAHTSGSLAAIARTPTLSSSFSVPRDSNTIHGRFLEITGHPLGLENFGNTCYCNSVIQLLYHCTPLRLRLLELHEIYATKKGGAGFEEGTILFRLCKLFSAMHRFNNRHKEKKRDPEALADFLRAVREKNALFSDNMQQDAHEFAMFILNDIMETEKVIMADPRNTSLLSEIAHKRRSNSFAFWKGSKHRDSSASLATVTSSGTVAGFSSDDLASGTFRMKDGSSNQDPTLTPLQTILQGQFGSLTACLECNTITARDELFIDLSLETTQGGSLLNCLEHFGDPEYFYADNKLRCDTCQMQVRAAKTIHVQQLPQYSLIVHLKRFQYDVAQGNFTKKADHVALPMHMDVEEYQTHPDIDEPDSIMVPDAAKSGEDKDAFKAAPEAIRQKLRGVARHKARLELTGFVAHLGEGPNLGHYFTCIRYGPQMWRRFDDDVVSLMTEREVQQYFGVPISISGVMTTTAYILLYERVA